MVRALKFALRYYPANHQTTDNYVNIRRIL